MPAGTVVVPVGVIVPNCPAEATMSKVTGGRGSITVTVRVAVPVFPAKSVTEYVTVYVPVAAVVTFDTCVMFAVTSPSTLSVAVAPRSR